MNRVLIGIRFIAAHGAADLKVMVPAGDWAERSIWRTLATLRAALAPPLATVRTISSPTWPEPTGRRQLTPAA